ncbi:hypothetical protein TNCV_3886141 [Trichonephila clavipes]|nr:hypothetical protein TNCV_3886141 [Trichonephila clavipes]
MLQLPPAGWSGWFGAGLVHSSLWVRSRLKLINFHDEKNRQRLCHIIFGHVRDSFRACLAWVLSAKSNSLYGFASLKLRCLTLESKLGASKVLVAIGMSPKRCCTKRRYQLPGNVLGLQW